MTTWTFSDGSTWTRNEDSFDVTDGEASGIQMPIEPRNSTLILEPAPGHPVHADMSNDWIVTEWIKQECRAYGGKLVSWPKAEPPEEIKQWLERIASAKWPEGVVF